METPRRNTGIRGLPAARALREPITTLGLSPADASTLEAAFEVKTVEELVESPLFDLAVSLRSSTKDPEHPFRRFGLPADLVSEKWLDKAPEEILAADLSAVDIDPRRRRDLERLGILTVADLAKFEPFVEAVEVAKESGRTEAPKAEGRLITERGTPVVSAPVFLRKTGFGGDAKTVAKATTNRSGFYSVRLRGEDLAGLEIWTEASDGEPIRLTEPRYAATEGEVKDAVLPVRYLDVKPELERMGVDLAAHVPELADLANLAKAKETTGQRDLTLINRRTGWDAVAVRDSPGASG